MSLLFLPTVGSQAIRKRHNPASSVGATCVQDSQQEGDAPAQVSPNTRVLSHVSGQNALAFQLK